VFVDRGADFVPCETELLATDMQLECDVAVLRFLKKLGPGLVAGASDDDPSGIATYAVAGAAFGYATLWTAMLTLPLMIGVQLVCARIGLVCGTGLTGALRRYPRWLVYALSALLLGANIFNIGADLGGMADAVTMLSGAPRLLPLVLFGAAIVVFTIYSSYRVFAKYVKWTTLVLLSYIVAAAAAHPDWRTALYRTFAPELQWTSSYLTTIVAILGTTISPYLFFWQASQEVEAEKALGRRTRSARRGATAGELADARDDVIAGDDALERGPVLHHPGDGVDAVSERCAHGRNDPGGGRSAAADRGRRGVCAVCDRPDRQRTAGDSGAGRLGVICDRRAARMARGSRRAIPARAPLLRRVRRRGRNRNRARSLQREPDSHVVLLRDSERDRGPAADARDHARRQRPAHHGTADEQRGAERPRLVGHGADGGPRASGCSSRARSAGRTLTPPALPALRAARRTSEAS